MMYQIKHRCGLEVVYLSNGTARVVDGHGRIRLEGTVAACEQYVRDCGAWRVIR